MSEATKVDGLIGSRVLEGRPGLHVHVHRPSPQLDFYEAYARFDGDEQRFRELVATLSLGARGTPEAAGHLPASWQAPAGVSLPWWDATSDTPPTAGARRHGKTGWIVAKLERGHIYLIVTDASE